jgi:hypothetical protein
MSFLDVFSGVRLLRSPRGECPCHARSGAGEQNIREIREIRGSLCLYETGRTRNITGLEVALLLNFKESKVAWKRVVRGQSE